MATPESQGYVAHLRFNAPAHFFTEADVGERFVRTRPYGGYDWSYTPKVNNASEIREKALKLVKCGYDYLKFQQKDPLDPICGWRYVTLAKNSSEENWDDGNWIPVEKCIQLFAQTPPVRVYYDD